MDFYGDNLFTTESEIKQNPERAKKFREASMKGWRYAMSNQQEMVDYILKAYPNRKEHDALIYEAKKIQQLIQPELVEIGYMLPGRWRHIAETYASLEMLPNNVSLDGFLYKTQQQKDYFWVYILLTAALFILSIIAIVATRFSRLNKKLLQLLFLRSRFANIGESVNNISHQWKQPLNELAIQLMLMEKTLGNDSPTEDDKNKTIKIIEKSHDILEFMAKTVDVFGQLLNRNTKKSKFYPKRIIQSLFLLVEDNFKIHQITISSKLEEGIELDGSPTELAHIILSILNNAKDVFNKRKITSPKIYIHLHESPNQTFIDISDNGGGIKAIPIESVFKLGVSSKQTNISGVGLFIAKQLTEEKFNGKILAENISSGARFKISFPKI